MDNTEEKLNSYSKVPYDNEPISRNSSYQKKQTRSPMKSSKVLTILMSLVIIVNIIMGVSLINLYAKNNNSEKVVNYHNYTLSGDSNSTSSSDINNSIAIAKARQSAVCVSAGYSITPSTGDGSMYDENGDKVGELDTTIDNKSDFFNMLSRGSGVILELDKDNGVAYIITCYHVIAGYAGTEQIYVLLYDSTIPMHGTSVFYSVKNDIAVLKVENTQLTQSNCRAADVADSSTVVMGETVHAIGNPLNLDFRSSTGTITNPEHLVAVQNMVYRVMGTDTPINPGNSGGGLFNSKGELIGIVNVKTQLVEIDNMGYAIPSNLAVSLARNIIRNTYPVQAVLGCSLAVRSGIINTEVVDGRELLDYEVLVTSVESGSAAALAGFKDFDEIVSFAYGNTVVNCRSQYSFADHAYNLNVGDKVTFIIKRNGQQHVLTVTISKVIAADSN